MARVFDSYLQHIVIDIINKRDFIDYGILLENTQVFFDREEFDIVIVSPYYFQYVSRNGVSLLDQFMQDPRFALFVNEMYFEITQEKFENLIGEGSMFDIFVPLEPEIVLIETMSPSSVKNEQKGMTSRRKLYGESTYF